MSAPAPASGPAVPAYPPRLARALVLDELFDLSLYRALRATAPPELHATLEELIRVETRHLAFWQELFGLPLARLDLGRRIKLTVLRLLGRLLGGPAIHLILEAIEVYGVRKYLALWETWGAGPLAEGVRTILEDELRHEDQLVSERAARRINPERIRHIFLGLNDGLVEMVGAVSGFFAALGNPLTVLLAASTTAVAGALSMAAGAYVAASSAAEVARTESGRRRFLGEGRAASEGDDRPLGAALLVGASYFAGALVPILPVLAGARSALVPLAGAGAVLTLVSLVLAFLSGMRIRRRIATNLVILAAAVAITYAIGHAARALWGIAV